MKVKERLFALIATCLAAICFITGVFMLFDPATTVAGYMVIMLAAVANGSAILILEKHN